MSGIYHTEYSFKGLHSTARRAAQKVSFVVSDIIRLPFAVFPSSLPPPLISLSFAYYFPVKLYTSYKAHINLIQGSYELNDKKTKKGKAKILLLGCFFSLI